MGHAFGPIVAKPKMRRSIRLEIDFLGLAPGKAPLCDTATLPADRNQLAMNQRLTQQDAELTRKVAIAGAQLAQFGAGKPTLNVSHDYDRSAGMEEIEATLLAINAADDERHPPETGVTAAAIKRIRNGRLYLIPASTETRGDLTTGNAALYAEQIRELQQSAPQRTM
jgi:hypothetical protein